MPLCTAPLSSQRSGSFKLVNRKLVRDPRGPSTGRRVTLAASEARCTPATRRYRHDAASSKSASDDRADARTSRPVGWCRSPLRDMKSGARWAAATSGWAHSHVQPLAHITGSMNIPLASTQHGEQTCLLSVHQNLPASREDRRERAARQRIEPTRPAAKCTRAGGDSTASNTTVESETQLRLISVDMLRIASANW